MKREMFKKPYQQNACKIEHILLQDYIQQEGSLPVGEAARFGWGCCRLHTIDQKVFKTGLGWQAI